MISLYYTAGAESGAWAISLLLGFAISPILTIITIRKIIYKK